MQEVTREQTHRVSNLQARAGPKAGDELTVQTSGVEGQRQLLRDTLELQLHLGANFLATAMTLVVVERFSQVSEANGRSCCDNSAVPPFAA